MMFHVMFDHTMSDIIARFSRRAQSLDERFVVRVTLKHRNQPFQWCVFVLRVWIMKRYLAIKYSFNPQMSSPDVNLQKRLKQLIGRQRLANSSEKDVLAARVAHLHLTR